MSKIIPAIVGKLGDTTKFFLFFPFCSRGRSLLKTNEFFIRFAVLYAPNMYVPCFESARVSFFFIKKMFDLS